MKTYQLINIGLHAFNVDSFICKLLNVLYCLFLLTVVLFIASDYASFNHSYFCNSRSSLSFKKEKLVGDLKWLLNLECIVLGSKKS